MGLLDKVTNFTTARDLQKSGLYHYFRVIESAQENTVRINGQEVIMLGSNNYLGLTNHPLVKEAAQKAVAKYGSGCAGSRFLNGTLDIHVELEEKLAKLVGKEAALVFSTGFMVNQGVIFSLVGRNDTVLVDRTDHASIIDGTRLCFGHTRKYLHNDMDSLEYTLKACEDNGKLIKSADNDRDEFDWFFLEPLFTGEAPGSFTVDDYAAVADVEGDGDFDLREFGLFQRGFTGNLVGVDPPLPPAPGSELLVQLSSGGATVVVAPGGLVRYSVTAEAADPANQGLAMISFDLDFDGGPLTPMETPTVGPMTGFVSPVGMSNPQGFGGTPVAGGLRQAGGAQNTINNAFAPQPTGAVVPGLGGWKSPVVVARGSLVAPTTPGTYTLSMSNVMGNVITEDTTGFPFWEVQPAPVRPVRDLTIVVEAGGPEIYCVGKPTSEGCTPEFFWGGTPSLTGTDDFVIRAQKVVGGEPGLAIFGLSAQSIPFQNGTLCVGNTFGRSQTTFALGTETCEGLLQWKFRQLHMIRMGLNPGDVLHSQWYFNDSAQPDGTATGLSDALKFTIQP